MEQRKETQEGGNKIQIPALPFLDVMLPFFMTKHRKAPCKSI